MKKLLAYSTILLSLTLCSCGGGHRRSNSSTTNGMDSAQTNSFDNVDKDLSYGEFKNIVMTASYVERDRMSRIEYLDGDGVFINTASYIERFNERYYHCHMVSNGYEPQDIYAYSTPDWEHNYYCSKTTESGFSNIEDYIYSEAHDQYIYAFGYSQIGFNPASFIACYGGMIFDDGFIPGTYFSGMHQRGNQVTFVLNNFAGSENMSVIGTMLLTSFGGCEKLSFYMTNNPGMPGEISIKTIFDNRNNPPREVVEAFMIYN